MSSWKLIYKKVVYYFYWDLLPFKIVYKYERSKNILLKEEYRDGKGQKIGMGNMKHSL